MCNFVCVCVCVVLCNVYCCELMLDSKCHGMQDNCNGIFLSCSFFA